MDKIDLSFKEFLKSEGFYYFPDGFRLPDLVKIKEVKKSNHLLIGLIVFILLGIIFLGAVFFNNIVQDDQKSITVPNIAADNIDSLNHKKLINSDQYIILKELIRLEKSNEIRVLLDEFEYNDIIDGYGWTLLHWAALWKRSEIFDYLILMGADKNIKSVVGWAGYKTGTTPADIFSGH